MRILNFYSENFKRIQFVEFNPDENVVVIAGKNGHGKTSVMDALWSTFQYATAKKKISEPIRQGQDHAKNVITTDDYVITRTFKGDSSSLRIENNNGDVIRSPQALLNKLVGDISFDPLSFANAKDDKRREMIEDVFDLDLADFEATDFSLKEGKKEAGRELKMIDGRLRAIKPPTAGEPTTEASAIDLIKEMTVIMNDRDSFRRNSKRIIDIREQIRDLRAEEDKLCSEQGTISSKYDQPNVEIDLVCDWIADKITNLDLSISSIESRNSRAREITEYMRLRALHDDAKSKIDNLKSKIELNKIERDEAIEGADIPIDGLTIEEDGVFMSGVPFDQISQAEKIKASIAIAIAANPELRVIRIMDGSLLDSDNLKLVEQMAIEHDMQVWIEKVDESGTVGIVIEDGEIKAIN